jgi:hypothetical protein
MVTLCPIAIVVGCEKCPVFKICPAKSIIGNPPKKTAKKTKTTKKIQKPKKIQKRKKR